MRAELVVDEVLNPPTAEFVLEFGVGPFGLNSELNKVRWILHAETAKPEEPFYSCEENRNGEPAGIIYMDDNPRSSHDKPGGFRYLLRQKKVREERERGAEVLSRQEGRSSLYRSRLEFELGLELSAHDFEVGEFGPFMAEKFVYGRD